MAEIVAAWLIHDFEPRDPTLLGADDLEEQDAAASDLARILTKVARRKRSREPFSVPIPRVLAKWFAGFHDSLVFVPGLGLGPARLLGLVKAPPAVFAFAERCSEKVGARKRAGRTQLSREQIEQRITLAKNEKQIERLKRRRPPTMDMEALALKGVDWRPLWRARREQERQLEQAEARPHEPYCKSGIRRLKKRQRASDWIDEMLRKGHSLLTLPDRPH
jgi:hypothetical protein